jgi:hypothetical protein
MGSSEVLRAMLLSVMCGTVLQWKGLRLFAAPIAQPGTARVALPGRRALSGRSLKWSKLGCHQPVLGQGQCHPAGIDRDPAPAPFSATKAVVPLPQVGSSTRSPGSVVMRHASFDHLCLTSERRKVLDLL